MDTRRLLTISAAACFVTGCVASGEPAPPQAVVTGTVATHGLVTNASPVALADIPLPATARPYLEVTETDEPGGEELVERPVAGPPTRTGRAAIAAANAQARAASRSDRFVGGMQVFAWAPGRVYEIWTAPLRVTTLTLAPGETVVSKAAGDTIRWQIGEATSGTGADTRTHVLLKPLERGLETNLVLTTSQRVYGLDLRSGTADAFNAAVSWDAPENGPVSRRPRDAGPDTSPVRPEGSLDARYSIRPRGRPPRWTPTAVFSDGVRTFITLPAAAGTDETPALFVIAADGEAQLVNYRQQDGLFVVDRVFDRAELRLGDRRPAVVRLERQTGGRP